MALNHLHIASLVAKVKAQDSQSFTQLYELTHQKLYFIALSILKDEYEAQDAVQDIYVHILSTLHTLKDDKLFVAWANKVAYNICIRQLSKQKDIIMEDNYLELAADINIESSPFMKTLKNERSRILMKHIVALQPELRITILFKYFEELKITEIAKIMDCPEGTVKSRLSTAKHMLRDSIARSGGHEVLLSAFTMLPLRSVLQNSAKGITLPPDTALNTLLHALDTHQMSTAIHFTPQTELIRLQAGHPQLRIGLTAAGVAGVGSAIIVGTLLITPEFVDISFPQAPTNQPVVVSAQMESSRVLNEFFALSIDTDMRYPGVQTSDGRYQVTIPENGDYTLYAVGGNGKQATAELSVGCIDRELPIILDYTFSEQEIVIHLQDTGSGVDFSSVYGAYDDGEKLLPIFTDPHSGTVTFALPDKNFKVYLTDYAGNTSLNQVKITWE